MKGKKVGRIIVLVIIVLSAVVLIPSAIHVQRSSKHMKEQMKMETISVEDGNELSAYQENSSVPEAEQKAFVLDTYLDHREYGKRLYIYDMAYADLAMDFGKKDLNDFKKVIQENQKISEKFKPLMLEYCERVFEKYPDVELRPFYRNLKNLEIVECTEDELLKVSWDLYSSGCYVKSENKIYVLKDKEYKEGTWDYQVIYHELSHCLRDSQYTDEDGNTVTIQFAGLNYFDIPNAEAINSLFAVSLFPYEETDIAYQLQSNIHKQLISCMDNYDLRDYVEHSLTYYIQQLDQFHGDDNYATTILSLMNDQYEDYYDDKYENPQSAYYPIYDYITDIYLNKHLDSTVNYTDAKGIMDEFMKQILFDVPEEYHIDTEHFYAYFNDYCSKAGISMS